EERELALDMRARYAETIRLSRARFNAGDISEAELKKIELEGLRYENDVIDAEMEIDLARQKLAALMGLPPSLLPAPATAAAPPRRRYELAPLVNRALHERPDVRAALQARGRADALVGQARREALPDVSLGISFTHSEFTVSGDNPNSLALSLSLPLPVFDR